MYTSTQHCLILKFSIVSHELLVTVHTLIPASLVWHEISRDLPTLFHTGSRVIPDMTLHPASICFSFHHDVVLSSIRNTSSATD